MGLELRVRRVGDVSELALWDAACGACCACRGGVPGRCDAPVAAGEGDRWRTRVVPGELTAEDVDAVGAAVRALDLVLAWRGHAPVVEVRGEGRARAAAAAAVAPFCGGARRRPDVVLTTDGDVDAAARSVRRGGAVGSVVPPTVLPRYATLVQRELDVLAPVDPVEAFELVDVRAVLAAA